MPLVEMRRIELLSENPSIQPSSWTVCYLNFPSGSANRHAIPSGSPFLHDRLKCERPMHVHHSDDVQSEAVVLIGGTGDPHVTALPDLRYTAYNLGSHSNSVVVVYFLSLGSLRDYPARHAYRISKSPSKPLHPHSSAFLLYRILHRLSTVLYRIF